MKQPSAKYLVDGRLAEKMVLWVNDTSAAFIRCMIYTSWQYPGT